MKRSMLAACIAVMGLSACDQTQTTPAVQPAPAVLVAQKALAPEPIVLERDAGVSNHSLVQQTRRLVRAGKIEEAIAIGRSAIETDSSNPEAFQALGRAFLAGGDLKNAISTLEKAVELKGDHGYALNNLGLAYLRANENAKAVGVLSRAAELLPRVAYVQNNWGIALERVGKIEEAKAAYLEATTLSPKYVKAHVNTARVAKAEKAVEEENDEPPGGVIQSS